MKINWFPGHMAKALRLVEDKIKLCDCVIIVLDARAPKSCLNEAVFSVIGDKPIIYALNKADLADKSRLNGWINKLSTSNSTALSVVSTSNSSVKSITAAIKSLCLDRVQKYKQKGINIGVRAMVLGVPNSGKSTLINGLCGQARTITGDKPGVTRGGQWVKVNDFLSLLDTPGILPPRLDDQVSARRLAYLGSVKEQILDVTELCLDFLSDINECVPAVLNQRYGVDFTDSLDTLNQIAKKRGYIVKGGELDLERTAAAVLDDFRKGRMGKITLEAANEP